MGMSQLTKAKIRKMLGAPVAEGANGDDLNNMLLDAASIGRPEDVAHWIAAGADPMARDTAGFTALMHAAFCGSLPCVGMLLPLSRLDDTDGHGNDAMALAQRRPDPAVANFIRGYASAARESLDIQRSANAAAPRPRLRRGL